jgi:glycosyltransferase involved in cell wall biosynthesis
VLSSDLDLLRHTARRWTNEPAEARERGRAARRYALERFGLCRFLDDWEALLKEVTR